MTTTDEPIPKAPRHGRWVCFASLLSLAVGCADDPATTNGATFDAGKDAPQVTPLDCSDDGADWPFYGGNVCNTRVTRGSAGITPANAPQLGVKWVAELAGDVSATPAVVGGQVYVPDWSGMLTRIDAATGSIVWS